MEELGFNIWSIILEFLNYNEIERICLSNKSIRVLIKENTVLPRGGPDFFISLSYLRRESRQITKSFPLNIRPLLNKEQLYIEELSFKLLEHENNELSSLLPIIEEEKGFCTKYSNFYRSGFELYGGALIREVAFPGIHFKLPLVHCLVLDIIFETKSFQIVGDLEETIFKLKQRIAKVKGINVEKQVLKSHGSILENIKRCKTYNLKNYQNLHLSLIS
jgi:hypothetical protein